MASALVNRATASLAALSILLSGCSRDNSPLLSSPGAGVTSTAMTAPQIDTHDAPFNRVFLRVVDNTLTPIQTFSLGNFSLVENGRPTVPDEVGPVVDPLYLALVIDRSGSMGGTRETAANTAATDLVNAIGASDLMAIVEFTSTVQDAVPFTSDKPTLLSVLTSDRSNGATAVYDATKRGGDLLNSVNGRKLLIVLTDGEDNSSEATSSEAAESCVRHGVSAFMVGLGSGISTGTLDLLSVPTGGETYTSADGSDLGAIFLAILARMENLVYVKYRKRATSGTLDIYLNYGSLTSRVTRVF